MRQIVSLDEAKLYLRVDRNVEDAQIEIMVQAATEAALVIADAWDGTGEPPARLKMAVLSHVAAFYCDREGIAQSDGVVRLLMPLRNLDV